MISKHPGNQSNLLMKIRNRPRVTYTARKDGEGWSVEDGAIFKIECCDCGLVHRIAIAAGDRWSTLRIIDVKTFSLSTPTGYWQTRWLWLGRMTVSLLRKAESRRRSEKNAIWEALP